MTANTASTPAAPVRGSAPCYSLHHQITTTTPGGNQQPESHHCLPAMSGRDGVACPRNECRHYSSVTYLSISEHQDKPVLTAVGE
ncbi:hypothetical protein G5714_012334 [Onychostoma macrolepis]|uniref:Uncharacterized protein n=1 Tax=Onychostoma macrolepis TaxID=369639 RepID=A0A7J6CGY4_9TELE|nr:hypothetical protein G5714_012334 [Onychostoma macrolepis]